MEPTGPIKPKKLIEVTLLFSPEAYERLERLLRKSGLTFPEMVRRGLQLWEWYQNVQEEGWVLYVRNFLFVHKVKLKF